MFAFLYVKANCKEICEEVSFPSVFQKNADVRISAEFKTNRGRGQRDNVRRTCASVDQQSAAASNPGTSAARGAYLAIGTIGRLIHRHPTKVTKDPPLYFAPPSCL